MYCPNCGRLVQKKSKSKNTLVQKNNKQNLSKYFEPKREFTKDRDKYFNLQKIFTNYESLSLISIDVRNRLNQMETIESNDPTLKENWNLNWILMNERKRLLGLAEQESNKPSLPPNLGNFSLKEKFFALKVNSYLFIYLKELMWEYHLKDPSLSFEKLSLKYNHANTIFKYIKYIKNTISKEEFDKIMRSLRIYYSKYKALKKLEHLQFTDKLEAEERNYAVELQIIISYLISKYTSQMIKGFDVIIKEQKVTIKRPDLNQLETQLFNYALINLILRKIISISTSLQDKELSEELREEYVQSRNKSRHNFDFVFSYEMWRSHQNGEDYEKFVEEYYGAHNVVKKFLKLSLNQPSSIPFLKDFLLSETLQRTLQRLNQSQVGVISGDLNEINKFLSEIDLTTEGRNYYLKREAVVELEGEDWEIKMKEFLADFPYSPHELITLGGVEISNDALELNNKKNIKEKASSVKVIQKKSKSKNTLVQKNNKQMEIVNCDKCGTLMNYEPCEGTFGTRATIFKCPNCRYCYEVGFRYDPSQNQYVKYYKF